MFKNKYPNLRNLVSGNIKLNPGTALDNQSSSKIIIKEGGYFELNKKWSPADPFQSLLFLGDNAKIVVHKTFDVYTGSKIYVNNNATLILGSGYINHNLNLSCFEKIEIGYDVAISENVTIRDSDNHTILNGKNKTQPIKIGDNVWIGINVIILKGVIVGNGTIIAAGSVVIKSLPANCLAGGVPARVIKENVAWK